jgi:hypothetical protein
MKSIIRFPRLFRNYPRSAVADIFRNSLLGRSSRIETGQIHGDLERFAIFYALKRHFHWGYVHGSRRERDSGMIRRKTPRRSSGALAAASDSSRCAAFPTLGTRLSGGAGPRPRDVHGL